MIIQIRGTGGSGKTTVMRRVIGDLSTWLPKYADPSWDPKWARRKQPLYYTKGNLVLLGHYESTCGGCDNVGSAAHVFKLIQKVSTPDCCILCEGMLLSEDVKWSQQLDNLRIIYLTTPLARCLKQIEGRRAAAGNDKPLNPTTTTRRFDVVERSRVRLSALGIECRRATSDQAPAIIQRWIREALNAV